MSIKSDVQRDYFAWLCASVNAPNEYSMLMDKLRRTDYVWVVDRDENRAKDGAVLRYKFAIDKEFTDVESAWVEECLSGPCSMLEMMVGLARKIEAYIMYDPALDDRTPEWFKEMLDNLGLLKYDDKHYEESTVDYILNRFMSRNYSENGDGNLFKNMGNASEKSGQIFRNLELWTQTNQYFANRCGT